MDSYITAVKKGLLKTFSRMGISTIRSFCGSQIFEAVGLGPELIGKYFTSTVSRVGGIGLEEIAAEARARHANGVPEQRLSAAAAARSAAARTTPAPAARSTCGRPKAIYKPSAGGAPERLRGLQGVLARGGGSVRRAA